MERGQIKRRTLLSTAVGALAVGAVSTVPTRAAAAATEQFADYAKHTADSRSVTVTSTTGQQLRLTAYGDQIVRVHAARAGESLFADTRYEMVVPANHTAMGGSLSLTVTADTVEVHTAAADGLRVVLRKRPMRLEFYSRATGALLAKEDATRGINWSGTNATVAAQAFVPPSSDEHFLKAGHGVLGRAPRLDRTGDSVSHNYADAYAAAHNPIDQAPAIVPFYLSSKGYGVFFNTTFDTTFNFGGSNGYGFFADGHDSGGVRPQVDYFVINGPRFSQLLDRYTQLTGRPRLPQRSIFGLHMSDKSFADVSTQAWWREKIGRHRAAGFPFDHQVNDNRWRAGSGSWSGSWFEFSPDRWPDPAGYQAWAAANGVTVTLDYNRNNTNEMAGWKAGPPPGYSLAAADLTNVKENNAVPDWSNPATRAWVWKVFWDKALNPALKYPGDGLWIDETDDLGGIPYTAKMADGRTWAEGRNAYFLNLHKGVGGEGWDPSGSGHIGSAKRPWTWSRGATAGQQRYGHYWTGDISQTYEEMQNQIRGMQTAGLGGFPFANIDGGGFAGGAVSDAFYRNWPVAWSSFSPIWRPHTGASTAQYGTKASRWPLDQGAQAQADFARYGRLRYTLMPYIYTLAHQAAATGMPMARAMVIDYQDRPQAYTHDLQYLWGPSLLVAPLTSDGGGVQQVWLPAGATWYNFWADIKHTGSDTGDFAYTTRTGETPLFVKAGAILPRYPYAQSTAYLTERQLEMEVYSGADGAFQLVEDDGVTEAYRAGAQNTSVTRLTYTDASTRVVIAHPQGTYQGAPDRRRYVVRFHGLAKPVGMRVNGGATLPAFTSEAAALISGNGAGSVWDAQAKILTVITAEIAVSTNGGTAATVEPSGAAFPAVGGGTVYQAESARFDSTFVLDTLHPGYTGTGYTDFNGTSAGATITWTVGVASAGTRQLLIRYANGSDTDRPVTIDVNGTKGSTLALPPTGSWDTWATASFTENLPQGTNVSVRATLTKATGANFDSLTVM
ncbi:TIM-barrel domain-containing protein [Kitasatospora sp. NBC_01539]|uniref:TIM-barrel domain-containing protein n=1 Tax=Kitasatospora sp. NBC_01539 TaxID=2903577 RepID=UPI0038601940